MAATAAVGLVTTGVAYTLVAGLATGVIYLLLASFKWARKQNEKTGIWLFKDVRSKFQSTIAAIHKSERSDNEVRDAIEKFITGIIGDGLDEAQVTRISLHPSYEEVMKKYEGALALTLSRLSASFQLLAKDLITGIPGAPDKILSQLKRIIKQIMAEGEKLPLIQRVNIMNSYNELAVKSYEDILATAILNKIIDSTQTSRLFEKQSDQNRSLSNPLNSSEDESNESIISEPEDNWSEQAESFVMETNLSEEETDEHYESDLASLNIYFNKRTAFPEFGVDIVQGNNSNNGYEKNLDMNCWEDNWLFRRKKLKQNISSSVAMLVPSPNEPVKAYIGDKEADETSDLSEYSDSELEELINEKTKRKLPPVNYDTLPVRDETLIENSTGDLYLATDSRACNDKESDSGIFEETVLRSSLLNLACRSKEGSHHFTVNPVFRDDSCYRPVLDVEQHFTSLQFPKKRLKTRRLVVPSREELFTSVMTSLQDLRQT